MVEIAGMMAKSIVDDDTTVLVTAGQDAGCGRDFDTDKHR
jgi:hypothetical protein